LTSVPVKFSGNFRDDIIRGSDKDKLGGISKLLSFLVDLTTWYCLSEPLRGG
jgi:hypothetical protein